MKSYIAILCFIYVFHTASGQNARINAPAQFILNTDMVQIDCQPAGTLYNSISVISILKNGQPMVSVGKANGQSLVAWTDSGVKNRATTNSPNLDTVSTAQLRVTIEATSTQCDDQAMYTCRVVGFDSDFNLVDNNEVSANVTVTVKPDRMDEMIVTPPPSAAGQYSEGENITLSCTGTVGAYADPPRIAWCIQRNGDFSPSDLESDSYFRSISQSNAQIVGSGATTSCQFQRTSIVVYQVANTDTDTTLWCQITAPGDSPVCGQGTVRQQKSIEVASTTPAPGSGAQTGAGTANAGAIAGGVIGGLAFIILVVLIIYFVFVRKRNPSETYRTREEKDGKGNPNVGNEAPVYSVPGKHGKEGYENKAIDEPHTKPRGARPDRHERDRDHRRHDGRGHANPAMYNHNDIDRDFDRDGTPEPRNAHPGGPMGSAV